MRLLRFTVVILFFVFSILSPAHGQVKTETAKDIDRGERYSLILYGARHGNDLESVVIFDIEGDDYTISAYAPVFDYEVERGLDPTMAIKRAREFISWHPLYQGSVLRKITLFRKDIGYELRPLYNPLSYGLSDLLDIHYWLSDKKVIVRIGLLPQIERMLYDGDKNKTMK